MSAATAINAPSSTRPWYRHRVFYYALTARICFSLHWIPHSWSAALYDNAAVSSLVAHPKWTLKHAKQVWVDSYCYDDETCHMDIFFHDNPWLERIVTLLLFLTMDYFIAQQFAILANNTRQDSSEEQGRLIKMPEKIQPNKAILDALPSSTTLTWLLPLLYFCNPAVIVASHVYACFDNVKLACLLTCINLHGQPKQSLSNASYVAVTILLALIMCAGHLSYGVFALVLPNGTWQGTLFIFAFLQMVLQRHGVTTITPTPTIMVDNIPPSLSVLWYTHMEFFTRFAPYLQFLLGYLPYIMIVPLAMRLHKYPIALVTIYWMIVHTLCQPISTLTDFLTALLLMLLQPSVCARMNPMVTMIALAGSGVPVVLYTTLHPLWLTSGAGEANFLYFQCLAFQIFVANIMLQFIAACLYKDKAWRMTLKNAKSATATSDKDSIHVNNTDNEDATDPSAIIE